MNHFPSQIVVFIGLGMCLASVVVCAAYFSLQVDAKVKDGCLGVLTSGVIRLTVYVLALSAVFGIALLLRQLYHGDIPNSGLLGPIVSVAVVWLAWWLRPANMR
jgi:hypothetical protein